MDAITQTPLDPKAAEKLQAGREIMRRYRDTLRVLAT